MCWVPVALPLQCLSFLTLLLHCPTSTALGCQPFCSDSKCFPLPTDYYLTSRLTFSSMTMILLQCCQDISMAFLCIQPKTQACFLASAYTFSLYSHSAAASSSVFLQLCAWHALSTVKNTQLLQLHVAIFHSKGHYRSYLDAIAKVT